MFDAAGHLHRLLEANLLEGDPRIFELKTVLGTQLVRHGHFQQARPHLVAAVEFFDTYEPRNHVMLARALNLLAEVERGRGYLEATEKLLEKAAEAYVDSGSEDKRLGLAIEINMGRFHVARGDYIQAEQSFSQVIECASELGPDATELLCLAYLNKSILYKVLFRLDEAERFGRLAMASLGRGLAPNDRALLPYYLAPAGIQILRRDTANLATSVDCSVVICRDNNLCESLLAAEVDHQRAMLHFLRCQEAYDLRESETARTIWRDLLKLQKRNGWRWGQARTLHFLSLLTFLDWTHTAERDRRELEAALGNRYAFYEQLFEEFESKGTRHRRRVEEYLKEKEAYQAELELYRRSSASTDKRHRDYATLLDRYEELNAHKQELLGERTDLERDQKTLEQAYGDYLGLRRSKGLPLVSQEGTHEPNGADNPLLVAKELASEAVDLLGEIDVYPNLRYAALCNYAQLVRVSGDGEGRAIAYLEQAVRLAERPRLSTFGGDILRAEFFVRYATAFDLLVAWLLEDGRPEEALVYSEMKRNRTFLDRIRADGASLADTSPELAQREQEILTQCAILSAQLRAQEENAEAQTSRGRAVGEPRSL